MLIKIIKKCNPSYFKVYDDINCETFDYIMIFSPEAYLLFKSFHIIFVVVCFSGLLYLVRLFIYHVEVQNTDDKVKQLFYNQYSLMERG